MTANIPGLPANHGYQSTTYQMAAEVGVLTRNIKVQECVPVESVPPAAVAVCCGGGGVCLSECWDTPPSRCLNPPGLGLDTSLGLDLDTPLGLGLGIDTPLAGHVTCKAYWDTNPPTPVDRVLDTRF